MREELKPGDIVRAAGWGTDTAVIERIDSDTYPDDPVAFFVDGGFWRASRLVKVNHP